MQEQFPICFAIFCQMWLRYCRILVNVPDFGKKMEKLIIGS